jgi:signal transduction histidine kinase
MIAPQTGVRVDATLRRIIGGFRLVTAVWISVLGVIAVVAWDARPGVVFGAVGVVWVWSGVTFWLAGSGRFESVPWLIADLLVAVAVVVLDAFDGASEGGFVGGYPMSSVLLWGYAFRMPGGLGSAAVVATGVVAAGVFNLAGNIVTAILYVAVGGAAAWAFEVLRSSELRRVRAEADLEEERAARIRIEERAEVAAHLHDSVLQTLALIQKGSSDPAEVRNLARVQERELRTWLLGANLHDVTVMGALEATCSDIEKRHGIAVELVAVGDRRLDDRLAAVVGATGESVMNAAKHAKVEKVSVFADATSGTVEVFIRDRGVGFDPASVGEDRRGLSQSVRGRMHRHGGTVEITSGVGTGTEVRLTMPVEADPSRAVDE